MISPKSRPLDVIKTGILIRVVREKGARYDNVATQLKIRKVFKYNAVVAELAEFERSVVTP